MNTVLFVNATVGFSENLFLVEICSNGGATYIIGKIRAKDNLKKANSIYTFENLLLQIFSTEFLDIAHK